jgi:hypothetical protein
MSQFRIPRIIEVGDPFSHQVAEVRVNGKAVEMPFYVDTRKGIVRAFRHPLQKDKYSKRLLTRTVKGSVEVITRD